MPLKFYVATRFSNKAEVRRARRLLQRTLQHEITYDWADKPLQVVTESHLKASAIKELEGVQDADYLVAILPGGFGTHVEIGAALVTDKPVFLVVPHANYLCDLQRNSMPFYRHPNVHCIDNLAMVPSTVERVMTKA